MLRCCLFILFSREKEASVSNNRMIMDNQETGFRNTSLLPCLVVLVMRWLRGECCLDFFSIHCGVFFRDGCLHIMDYVIIKCDYPKIGKSLVD